MKLDIDKLRVSNKKLKEGSAGVFNINFEHISDIVLVFSLLAMDK